MARLSDFDYDLPEERIAQEPLADRADARLLWLHKSTGHVQHRRFREIPDILRPGDLLVVNDTRVTALRLYGRKPTGGRVECLLLRERDSGEFEALVRPARRLGPGTVVEFEEGLAAEIRLDLGGGQRLIRFFPDERLGEKLAQAGEVPLPPYIGRKLSDPERYQTVFARQGGSAAAPTAGLHFTPEIVTELHTRGIGIARVTLDVGLDTFRPVTSDNIAEHRMHGEWCEISDEAAAKIASCRGRVIAVGTTVVRTLETFAVGSRRVESGRRRTEIFIAPGHRFQVIDGMFTNFHMPRTTMLMMIGALAGVEEVMEAYRQAVAERYRFLSFGDSMLIADPA
ncbi:MAG: tRNA preQ1(34) S-adenosylmethionine ribosyltransferase-isomerase QueA [Fimbriimonadaceae bacterium]